jgi:Ca-activated chloride channel homolog
MHLLSLTLAEFLALYGAVAAVAVTLYLLDRSARRLTVPTLRFWTAAENPPSSRRRRRIQQPLSLLLQLLALALLLLAVAELRWGAAENAARDHVLILDTSAWMGAHTKQGRLIDQARALAQKYLRALPPSDRVMVVRADALATPASGFEADRHALEQLFRATEPGSTALNIEQALAFADGTLRLHARRPGEIVYIGAGRVAAHDSERSPKSYPNLRVLPVGEGVVNCGLRKLGLRRSPADPEAWEIYVSVRNDSSTPRTAALVVEFGGAPVGTRRLELAAGAEQSATFTYRTRAAGWVEARLMGQDDFAGDDRAQIEVPSQASLHVTVYSARPELLRPLLAANMGVEAVFHTPAQYRPQSDNGILILDRFAPPAPQAAGVIYIEPPVAGSPIPVRGTASGVSITRWDADHTLAAGLRAQDLKLSSTELFEPAPGDIRVAETARGPVVVARPGKPKLVVLGFHPLLGGLRNELSTPLLAANILRWMSPEVFRRWELTGGAVGSVSATLDEGIEASAVRLVADNGAPPPFTVQGRNVRFFAGTPGTVRVLAGDREMVYSLTLPEVGELKWEPAGEPRRGLPRPQSATAAYDLWRWLALLAAATLVLEWFRYDAAPPRRPVAMALKAATLLAILAALIVPPLKVAETKMAVAVLADTSASVSDADLARESSLVKAIEGARGRHRTVIVPFARATRETALDEYASGWRLRHTAGEAGRGTDLEAAVRNAAARLPAGLVPRLVLISDGKENRGSLARAAWQAQQLRIPVDTYALAGRPKPALRLESASLPAVTFTGERFPLDLRVESPHATRATIEIAAEGKMLGTTVADLAAGTNHVRAHASVLSSGSIDLSGVVRTPDLGEVRFAQALALRRPRALLVSQDPPGTGTHFEHTLAAAQFDLVRAGSLDRTDWSAYQLVVLNNLDLESIPAARKAEIEEFVQQGGGLLVIGGERNVYREKKTEEDALERSLPAKLAPPRSPEGTCVILIIDKSSSMEGKKIELARLAAIGVIQNLRPIDMVGVLIFDNSFQWAVPVRRAEDRSLIKRMVSGITPDGGTQIAPALAEAYHRILPVKATYKHIVLLTDGISEEGDSMTLAREADAHHVTISTVGLGQDVNRGYLEKVAVFAGGKAYFLSDPAGLEQILLRDVMEHTGSTAVERPFQPLVRQQAEILDGVGMPSAPSLKGYVKFIARPAADTILAVDQKDPLLVRWQYGLGRAAVFASDAKSRWAADWIGWSGFDKFWANLCRDLLPHAQAGEAVVEYDRASDELVADYRLGHQLEDPANVPDIFVFGPGGFMRPVAMTKLAGGAYRGRVPIGGRQGLFRLRPLREVRAFPEIGFYRQEDELSDYGSDEGLLRQISQFTGGRFNPEPAQVFDPAGRSVAAVLRLWPGLLALAILLNLAELALRKWLRPAHKYGSVRV